MQLDDDFDVSDGMLDVDTGFAMYRIKFVCLVFKPFKNEILIATVTQANSVCTLC